MAEKKNSKAAENAPVTPITLTDSVAGDIYVLQFNRDTVKFAEARRFNINEIGDVLNMTAIEDLFYYSFRMHQPKISKAETDKFLYDKLGGLPVGMIERLVDMYLEPFMILKRTEEKAKNASMTVQF